MSTGAQDRGQGVRQAEREERTHPQAGPEIGSRLDRLEALEIIGADHMELLGTVKWRIHAARRAVRPLLAMND